MVWGAPSKQLSFGKCVCGCQTWCVKCALNVERRGFRDTARRAKAQTTFKVWVGQSPSSGGFRVCCRLRTRDGAVGTAVRAALAGHPVKSLSLGALSLKCWHFNFLERSISPRKKHPQTGSRHSLTNQARGGLWWPFPKEIAGQSREGVGGKHTYSSTPKLSHLCFSNAGEFIWPGQMNTFLIFGSGTWQTSNSMHLFFKSINVQCRWSYEHSPSQQDSTSG